MLCIRKHNSIGNKKQHAGRKKYSTISAVLLILVTAFSPVSAREINRSGLPFAVAAAASETTAEDASTSETGDTYPDGTLADYYGLVRAGVKHDLPTVIIEHAFLDSDSDYQEYLCDEEKLEKLAAADARGIARYYQLVSEDEEEALPSLESVKEKLVLVKDNNAAHNEIFYKVYYDDDSRENSQTGMAREDDDDSGEEQMIREVIDAIIKMLTHNK